MDPATHNRPKQPDYLLLLHRWSGLLATPFLVLSILLALGLSHSRLLDRLSEHLYDSLPIPQVGLDEAIRPGSWDQALKLAQGVTGARGRVITSRGSDTIVVQAFVAHSHDPQVMKTNPHVKVVIGTREMRVVDIRNKQSSLTNMGHSIHAFRLWDREYLSLALVSSLSLLILLITGGLLAWRRRQSGAAHPKPLRLHVRLGQATALLVCVIAVTSLEFEFNLLGQPDREASHPIPTVSVTSPLQPGSLDQARELVTAATGSAPRGAYIYPDRHQVKFSEAGDGIGGRSVWVDTDKMTIKRITDWRNDNQALMFILHDGRWLGGLNAFNINDAVALVLLWLIVGGWVLYRSGKRRAA